MTVSIAERTSHSLLGRLKRDVQDQGAWAEFVRRYGQRIYRWCRQWQLQEADAQDVTQTVLVKLANKMQEFSYDPAGSFRAYLKTLTHYAWCDFLAAQKKRGAAAGGSIALEKLQSVEARDDLVKQLSAEFDPELLEEAMQAVQGRVEPHTWEAFRLTALDGLSGAAAGQQLGMKVATVFKAKSKVLKMLQEHIATVEN